MLMTPEFKEWFGNSIVADESGNPLVVYHGSIEAFKDFDKTKIKACETDAVYNGFWFTSDESSASPAFRDPKFIRPYYLSLQNPAPKEVYMEVYEKVRIDDELYSMKGSRSYCDSVRMMLQDLGYDGIIHRDIPVIDWEQYENTGQYTYETVRGTKYTIKKDKEFGGLDLYYSNGEYITGYLGKDDFMGLHSERVFVVFEPNQILSAKL